MRVAASQRYNAVGDVPGSYLRSSSASRSNARSERVLVAPGRRSGRRRARRVGPELKGQPKPSSSASCSATHSTGTSTAICVSFISTDGGSDHLPQILRRGPQLRIVPPASLGMPSTPPTACSDEAASSPLRASGDHRAADAHVVQEPAQERVLRGDAARCATMRAMYAGTCCACKLPMTDA